MIYSHDEDKKKKRLRNLESDTNDNDNIQNYLDTLDQKSNNTKSAEIFDIQNIPIPKRPNWDKSMSKQELHELENETFLNWRRKLAKTIEYISNNNKFEISPFEKNIEIWRQLWRVIENQILFVIVDARIHYFLLIKIY